MIKERAAAIKNKESWNIEDLLEIMTLLRSEDGCPWDREQTHKSIRKNLIEETYEVVEAIDNDDPCLMREELGDLLLQIVFHAEMAKEAGRFSFSDVSNDICKKLITRHPHIFGEITVENTEQVLTNWDSIKMQEKKQKSPGEAINSVSRALPALMRAEKMSSKAIKYEIDNSTLEDKIGDILLSISSICASNGIDSEKALYNACERMSERIKKDYET